MNNAPPDLNKKLLLSLGAAVVVGGLGYWYLRRSPSAPAEPEFTPIRATPKVANSSTSATPPPPKSQPQKPAAPTGATKTRSATPPKGGGDMDDWANELMAEQDPGSPSDTKSDDTEGCHPVSMAAFSAEFPKKDWQFIDERVEYPIVMARFQPRAEASENTCLLVICEDVYYEDLNLNQYTQKQRDLIEHQALMTAPPRTTRDENTSFGPFDHVLEFEHSIPIMATGSPLPTTLRMKHFTTVKNGVAYMIQLTSEAQEFNKYEPLFNSIAARVTIGDNPTNRPVNKLVYSSAASKVRFSAPGHWTVIGEGQDCADGRVIAKFTIMQESTAVVAERTDTGSNQFEECKFDSQPGFAKGKYVVTGAPDEASAKAILNSVEDYDGDENTIRVVCPELALAFKAFVNKGTVLEHRFGQPCVTYTMFDDGTDDEPPLFIITWADEEDVENSLDEWFSKVEKELTGRGSTIKSQTYSTIAGERCINVVSQQVQPAVGFMAMSPELTSYNSIFIHGGHTYLIQLETASTAFPRWQRFLDQILDSLELL
eukprot:TRINITY_DN67963_c2_g1_i1.p1 TRINITY_DN67963_c2_g1~~TRINITY_DN67963_c2_g1_i1.p1  ORF type:complete len:553 (-),score=51.05 TRINITY_DN67963_c2_g1_i1:243-1868(-)